MAMMKAGVVHAPKVIRYEDIKKPVPEAGEVLVKVKYTGICGSDVPRVNGTACHFYPNVLGHAVSHSGKKIASLPPRKRLSQNPSPPLC